MTPSRWSLADLFLSKSLCLIVAFAFTSGLVGGLAGCAETPTVKEDPEDTQTDAVGGDGGVAGDTAEAPDGEVADTAAKADSSEAAPDTAGEELDTSPPIDAGTTKCSSNQFCQTLLADKLLKCETAYCDEPSGQCVIEKKLGTCCNESDCPDKNKCTTGSCDLSTNTCAYAVIADCCPGAGNNVIFAKTGFEQGGKLPGGWTSKNSLKGSNVEWHNSTNRARSGKRSLYLGNACKTYDTSMDEDDGCKAGAGKTFKAEVSSTEALVPAKTDSIAHFWLWLDSEPLYTKTDKKKLKALDASNKCTPKSCNETSKCAASGPCCPPGSDPPHAPAAAAPPPPAR